ncbi:hypothetical protein CDL12_16256 [Handroanthus impetiginosus]|uniref:Enhancer of polycomb-like protein n=1 Tax=Handroanthus impetiginosus TaxID=429701 RepID=A0A2G9H0V1_9LAMI|nr:hypothetical protein CDL12_16256 [Handroanthus impetiginosus]
MPSVGMRRSTRVFGTRVLRSGRRLWTEPHDSSKYMRPSHSENKWPEFLDNSANGGGDDGDRCKDTWLENESSALMDVTPDPKIEEREPESVMEVKSLDKMFGIVYRRKRKRAEFANASLTEDKKYGKKFVRKEWMKKCRSIESFGASVDFRDSVRRFQELAIVVNGSSCDCSYWITCFLTSVLSYMTRVRIGMRHLLAFVLSNPIFDAYFSRGVLFIQDSFTAKRPGMCIISGVRSRIPLFWVDFWAIPSFFVHIQTNMHLRSAHLACSLVAHSSDLYEKDEKVSVVADNYNESLFQIPSWRDHRDRIVVSSQISPERDTSYSDAVASSNYNSATKELSHLVVGLPKSALQSFTLRNSRSIQKRRSSPRHKRGRQPATFQAQQTSGALVSDVLRIKQDGIQVSGPAPSRVLRSSDKRTSNSNMTQDVCTGSCSANLLVTETDKCYRVEGATITLELSASSRWFLAVMKDGTKRYSLMAEKVMRPPGSNRFTHDIIWIAESGWKLEFQNKQDWLIFKEIYKECSDRNMQLSAASVIPVPGVQEVSSPVDTDHVPYVRPHSYITMKDDELIRALAKKTAIYDMDSDDDEWLAKLNDELYAGRELQEHVKPESFELIIDALEKGFHCNLDEHFDGQAAYESCMHLERREVIEAVRSYWIKKRKQKRSALARIFQLYQPRRTQVIPKSVLRKKRTFKRQASQVGRGKQRPFLQAIAAEREAMEQQKNAHKVQEAKAVADRSEELAILKRQRAQMLMENADLATYKATMALKIAEAAQISKAPGTVSSFFLVN